MRQRIIARLAQVTASLALFGLMATPVLATNGYFAHGYGVRFKALGGAGVALPLSSLAIATNPAGMVFLGNQYDFGVSIFNPNRQYTVIGNPSGFPGTFGLTPGTVESGSKVFVIPYFGANWMAGEENSISVSVYGNGGMNTNYDTNTFYGSGGTGVDLAQIFVAPTFARKLAANHAIGVTAILAFQRFEAKGLQAFGMFSRNPNNITNNGHDNSVGVGARIGYMGKIAPVLSIGASYQTEVKMSEFDSYAGLFAEQGDFDIPASWTAGVAIEAAPGLTLLADVQQMLYSGIKSVSNPLDPRDFQQGILLGDDNGAGFGWQDMTVFKFGVQYESPDGWALRGGFSFGDQPIPSDAVLFNILAPGVIEQHATVGFTRALGNGKAISVAIMRAFSKTVSGPNPLEAPGQQTIELKMDQWEFTVGLTL